MGYVRSTALISIVPPGTARLPLAAGMIDHPGDDGMRGMVTSFTITAFGNIDGEMSRTHRCLVAGYPWKEPTAPCRTTVIKSSLTV